ncbi:MAG TPA: hypothetical protein VJQ45_13855, partial [Ktedonobacterales bacterium]|nr:hypothetical protein [Ktedonobacterales bacterium]
DPWLSKWGERQAVKAVLAATMRTTDQAAGLAAFLKEAQAPVAAAAASARQSTQARSAQSARGTTTHAAASAAPSSTASLVTVQPRTIDFGQLKSGQRGTVSITIRGQNGASVNGQIISPHPWITLDRQSFSGSSTLVRLTAETSRIAATGKQYSSLQIETGAQHIYVPITAEIVRAPRATTAPQSSASYATQVHAAVAANAQVKHAAPPLGRPLNLGFLGALLLAMGLAVTTLALLPSLLALWAPGLFVGAPLMLALLALTALIATPGALIGSGGRGWPGRFNTTLAGAAIGFLIALATVHTVLLAGFTLPKQAPALPTLGQSAWSAPHLFTDHPALTGALLLAAAMISLGAALGAERFYSGIMLRIGAFIRRFSGFFWVVTGIIAGGAGAWWLVRDLPWLLPVAVVTGSVIGGILGDRINRITMSLSKSRHLNQHLRSLRAQAGRPRTKGYP